MANAPYIHEDFFLESDLAQRLYHEVARDLPIIDYHSHLPPDQIARDEQFANLTRVWLTEDHYKWRAMRADGVAERFLTGRGPDGDASDYEKFEKWAATLPHLLRNPLYQWTHLELTRLFGISDLLLGPETAKGIWDECAEKLAQPEFSCRGLMQRMQVRLVCTTDDPIDSLEHHRAIAADPSCETQVLPTWRPDKALAVEDPAAFNAWVDRLGEAADIEIGNFDDFLAALHIRHEFFHEAGCRLSDRSLGAIPNDDAPASLISSIFLVIRSGQGLPEQSIVQFKTAMLHEFGLMDHARNWTQQMHLGPLRNVNSRMFAAVGADAGFDTMGDCDLARPLVQYLDRLDRTDQLPRTILYNINPRDSALIAAMTGNFQDGVTPGKIQWGGAWWFQDQKDGIERHLEWLSQIGLLSRFVGMLTDSRSFLSFTRHEYFRRILCNVLGGDMTRGIIPNDFELVASLVRDVCYNNAERYFGFNLGEK